MARPTGLFRASCPSPLRGRLLAVDVQICSRQICRTGAPAFGSRPRTQTLYRTQHITKATCEVAFVIWRARQDYSGHPALHPCGAVSLQSTFKFVPDKFVEPGLLPSAVDREPKPFIEHNI